MKVSRPHRVPVIGRVPDRQRQPHRHQHSHSVSQGQLGIRVRCPGLSTILGHDRSKPGIHECRSGNSPGIEAGGPGSGAGEDGATLFFTDPTDMDAVSAPCPSTASPSSRRNWVIGRRTQSVSVKAERAEVEAFLEAIDADDDVQNVYVGLAIKLSVQKPAQFFLGLFQYPLLRRSSLRPAAVDVRTPTSTSPERNGIGLAPCRSPRAERSKDSAMRLGSSQVKYALLQVQRVALAGYTGGPVLALLRCAISQHAVQ